MAETLFRQGAATFFAAHFGEAWPCAAALPRATIAVLHGLTPHEFADAIAHAITPVINDARGPGGLAGPRAAARRTAARLRPSRHRDEPPRALSRGAGHASRPNRSGLPASPQGLAQPPGVRRQGGSSRRRRSSSTRSRISSAGCPRLPPAWPTPAASSGGRTISSTWSGPARRCTASIPLPAGRIRCVDVVTVRAPILQVRSVDSPMTVGYGATHAMAGKGRVAAVAFGYADGYRQSLAAEEPGQDRRPYRFADRPGLHGSGDPRRHRRSGERSLHPGAMVEFIGPHRTVDAGGGGGRHYQL